MPTHRLLPQSLSTAVLDDYGMASDAQQAGTPKALLRWCTGGQDQHELCVAHANPWKYRVEQHVSRDIYIADANSWALSYGRDFRALHQFCHDHDCKRTRVKHVKNNNGSGRGGHSTLQVRCLQFFLLPPP